MNRLYPPLVLFCLIIGACSTIPPQQDTHKTQSQPTTSAEDSKARSDAAQAVPTPAGADSAVADSADSAPTAPAPVTSAVPAPDQSRSPLPPLTEIEEVLDQPEPAPTLDLTVTPQDLWQRVRNGFAMPNLYGPAVAEQQAWYLNHPELLDRILNRSGRYLYHIIDELERRHLPNELALLPMVESAFNPLAASKARAMGMWQFIPSTGKLFKLDQNWWRDERRDIIASTNAALDYLEHTYEIQGDWHLALASYNWGEGAVARAVAKNKAKGLPADFENLRMPRETQQYVPKLQALKNIIAQPDLFGIALPALPNEPYFDTVDLPGDMDVAVAAKLAEMPLDEFIALNPAYHRPLIRGSSDTQLVLPTENIKIFQDNLARYEAQDKPLAHWRTYRLKKGETLKGVAARHGLSVSGLMRLNGITPRMRVKPGHNLLVPGPGANISPQLSALLPKMQSTAAKPVRKAKGKRGKSTKRAGSSKNKKKATAKKARAKGKQAKAKG